MRRPALVLAGRAAVVTGAGSGIGRALALCAVNEGMKLAICDRDRAGLEETAALAGGAPIAAMVDVTDGAALGRFAAEVTADAPPVALVFANAGLLRTGPVRSAALDNWRLQFEVNVIGAVATVQAFLPAMIAAKLPGQIVITGSTGSMSVWPGLGAYCATKHALWPIADTLREELAAEGAPIGVSLLMPGAVATRIFDASDPDREPPEDSIAPDAAAAIAFDGARRDLPLILTHPHFAERAQQRFDAAVAALRATG